MKELNLAILLLILSLLTACKEIQIKDAKDCTTAGIIQAGAECATTLSHQKTSMTYEEFVYFLEPQHEHEENGNVIPKRGGAICRSVDDYINAKNALEQACIELKNRCTYELKSAIDGMEIIIRTNQDFL